MVKGVTNRISELCINHTDLTNLEINFLEEYSLLLAKDVSLSEKDVFIDVKDSYSDEGLVIFHKFPATGQSIYEKDVVGKLAFRKDEPGVLRSLETGNRSSGLFAQSQEGKIIEQDVIPIIFNNRVIAVLIIEQIVSAEFSDTFSLDHSVREIKLNQKSAKSQNDITDLRIPIDILDKCVLLFNRSGGLVYYNGLAENLYKNLGYFNTIGKLNFDNLTLANETFDDIKTEIKTLHVLSAEKIVMLNGSDFLQRTIYLEDRNQILVLISKVVNSTTAMNNKSNDFFEIQEIHHRVKNNLQSIISILRLQARRVKSSEAKQVLQESINRVMSIAATHELLSRQKSDEVNLSLILTRVLENFKQAYCSFGISLTYSLNEHIVIGSDLATTISLIVTELIQNAYEHAFDQNVKQAQIKVSLKVFENTNYLQIIDNGLGFDVENVSDSSLGMQLVESLVGEKLKGKFYIESKKNKGTKVEIVFTND